MLQWGKETATIIPAYVIYTRDTAVQSTVGSNYEEMQPLFIPGLGVLLCAILGPQPSSEGSGSADILQVWLGGRLSWLECPLLVTLRPVLVR